jgi:hypothetical protein
MTSAAAALVLNTLHELQYRIHCAYICCYRTVLVWCVLSGGCWKVHASEQQLACEQPALAAHSHTGSIHSSLQELMMRT